MWNHLTIIQMLKNKIPLTFKILLIRIIFTYQKIIYPFKKTNIELNHKNKKRTIYLLLSTDYSNLGDHGMTYAHMKMLEDVCDNSEIVEVLVSDTMKVLKKIKKNIKTGDIITLKGGGNIGLEYFREELYRREIVKQFKNNRVIIFPQTAYFPDSKLGRKEFEKTKFIYSSNESLHLFLRDEESFDLFSNSGLLNKYLVPDIVQSLDDIVDIGIKRKGLMFCMRADVEGTFNSNEKTSLLRLGEKYFSMVKISDTTTKYNISIKNRKNELDKIWNEMLSSELIITDRLHGMIFAAITRTPCIVFKTYNYKLSGQYRWLKHLDFIKFLDFNEEELERVFKEFLDNNYRINDRKRYLSEFEQIKKLLRGN